MSTPSATTSEEADAAAATESFSREMRRVTRQKHKISDALVNAKLVFALSDPGVWLDGLLCFHPIFVYLERHVPADQLPLAAHRAAAIEADIRYYCAQLGEDAAVKLAERRPSVTAYLRHLDALVAEDAGLLLAYAYHLYMGMLSGGQILQRKRRMYAKLKFGGEEEVANADDGYRSTEFAADGPTVAELKAAMRRTMDEVGVAADAQTRRRLLEESCQVFELNNAMIRSIRGGGWVAVRKLALTGAVVAVAVLVYRWFG